ncbi:TetR/AcrR family transcriptional regulator [Atopomonas sediminilitoris]|uniref:TetR/AcrR family transcriptional regulator n=1 Tax=Atopomonas sediminilitoris TaxID=2919919 RepID=UPI001F4E46FA|nr:TetR/AcrR family transcriptional regulator [Atopomonas sediminilitoris]MCJ8169052.1 TetR/AcrR family transcriptional regulator [Atopomonas sediminilitoris]
MASVDNAEVSAGLRISPRQQRAHEKIERILDALAQLLQTEEVAALSVASIARAAGLPAPTLYHYFPDKLSVLMALAERTAQRVDSLAEQALAPLAAQAEPQVDCRQLVQTIYRSYRSEPGYVQVLRACHSSQELKHIAEQSNQRMADVLVQVFAGRLPESARSAVRRIALMLSQSCQAHLDMALEQSDEREALAIVDEAGHMIDVLYQHYRAHYLAD